MEQGCFGWKNNRFIKKIIQYRLVEEVLRNILHTIMDIGVGLLIGAGFSLLVIGLMFLFGSMLPCR